MKQERWKTYLESLFHDVREKLQPVVGEGPVILVERGKSRQLTRIFNLTIIDGIL